MASNRSVKNPRAWLDQGNSANCSASSHARHSAVDEAMHPAHTGSTIRAKLKLLDTAANGVTPSAAA